MIIRLLILIILNFTLIACSSPEKNKAVKSKKLLSSNDDALLELAVNLQKKIAQEVWPGFADFKTSVVFFSSDGQFLLNPKGPVPQEYQIADSKGPGWSPKVYFATEWFAQDGSKFTQQEINTAYLANAFSSQQTAGHFSYSVFFLDSIQRFHLKEMKWDVDDWLSIFWHEVFHNYQDSLYKPDLVTNELTDFSNVKHFVQSKKFLKGIKNELKVLTQALKTTDPSSKRKIICEKLVPMKIKRYKRMSSKSVASEQFYEISEGTARYVEELMSMAAGKLLTSEEVRKTYLLQDFKFFEKYAVRDRTYYFDSIQDVSPSKRYFYNTGFGLALLLDQVQPNWKNLAFIERGFLFTRIKTWCEQRP